MRNLLLAILFCFSAVALSARTVTGVVTNGADNTPAPGMTVSDGFGFAETDANGRFEIELSPKAKTIWLHRDSKHFTGTQGFWHPIADAADGYDFTTYPTPWSDDAPQDCSIVMFGDPEGSGPEITEYIEEIKRHVLAHPDTALILGLGDFSNWDTRCLFAHRDQLDWSTAGTPVAFIDGNHDHDYRMHPGNSFGPEKDPYESVFGPMWYSFELAGHLFASQPIYATWGAPPLYDPLDAADWLRAFSARYPAEREKILFCHERPDETGFVVRTHDGDFDIRAAGFHVNFFGHTHRNIVNNYPDGGRGFGTGTPCQGGGSGAGPTLRTVKLHADGSTPTSRTWNIGVREQLDLLRLPGREVCVTAEDGAVEVTTVAVANLRIVARFATSYENYPEDGHVFLARTAPQKRWHGTLPESWFDDDPLMIAAVSATGRVFMRPVAVKNPADDSLKTLWETELTGTILPCDLRLADGLLLVGLTDVNQGENGGLYALDPNTGKVVWKALFGEGTGLDYAIADGNAYAMDTRNAMRAIRLADGKELWKNEVRNPGRYEGSTRSNTLLHDGILVGGTSPELRGVDAATGRTLWTAAALQSFALEVCTLAPLDDECFLVIGQPGCFCIEWKTGKQRWFFKSVCINSFPLVEEDDILLFGRFGHIFLLDKKTGELLSDTTPFGSWSATPRMVTLPNGVIAMGTGPDGLIGLDRKSLSVRWKFLPDPALIPTDSYTRNHPPSVVAAPVFDGDTLWVCGADGALYRVNPDTGVGTKALSLGMPILNTPATDGNRLYLSDCEGRVLAVEK